MFGGSFSPPHMGHVLACHYALMRWSLNKIMVIPSYAHPFGKPLPPYEDRVAMCRLAFSHLGDAVEISEIERDLGGVSYTIETVRRLVQTHPRENFRLIVGGDILGDAPKWREFDALIKMAPLLVVPRAKNGEVLGGTRHEAALPDMDSTAIRARIAKSEDPAGAVPRTVLEYIKRQGLYVGA